MTESDPADQSAAESNVPWPLLAVGGALGLCCLVAAPTAGGAIGAAAASGTTATLGGSVIQILVTALAVGTIGVMLGYWKR